MHKKIHWPRLAVGTMTAGALVLGGSLTTSVTPAPQAQPAVSAAPAVRAAPTTIDAGRLHDLGNVDDLTAKAEAGDASLKQADLDYLADQGIDIDRGAIHVQDVKYTKKQKSKNKRVVKYAKKYLGRPYRSGGSTPKGWDCSGYTRYVYKKAKVKKLPHSSRGQRHAGKVVSKKHAHPGDLIYRPGHVGIYAGHGKMYDAGTKRSGTSHRSYKWMGKVTFIRVV